ncbi:MAG TPA: hypothetical protein PL131_06435 [Methylotenera sp.]|nr:hypothetical protein [Methylotenera sp.]HPH05495.1 hypothetical protein [Methylotenera sp.]HPN00091.1 hypothetical protein [Methylotenera sp.]
MVKTERNACMDSFIRFCDEIGTSSLVGSEEAQYWVYERGYRAAMDELIQVMETGKVKDFSSPKLQLLVEKLAQK